MKSAAHSTILITGGARSGKSSYAQELALAAGDTPWYIATAKAGINDTEFAERINRHKADRDERWTSVEEPLFISSLPLHDKVVVIDCVTLWLTNFFSRHRYDADESLKAFQEEIDALLKIPSSFYIVTNEIGMGVHAETEVGRKFTGLQGWANQYIAERADKVILMVSGIPVTIKDKQ